MKKNLSLLIIILALVAGGLSLAAVRAGGGSKVDIESERAALLKVDSDFSKLSVEKGTVEAFLANISDDAMLLPVNAHPVIGREAIRAHLSEGSGIVLSWKPVKADVSSAGDLGYTHGTYELKATGQDGKPVTRYGKYVTIWKKKDGAWKVAVDIGNQSPSPETK